MALQKGINPEYAAVYMSYGIAIHHAQGLERMLHSVYLLVYESEPSEINADTFSELINIPNNENLGTLIFKLKSKVRISSLERQLYDALHKRNFLIHEYFWKRAGEIETPEGRRKMLDELAECANFFAIVGNRLQNILFKWTLQQVAGEKDIEPFLRDSELFDTLNSDK